jgi:hypothetical protein
MTNLRLVIMGLIFLGIVASRGTAAASDYEEVVMTNGGTLTGRITLKGPVPGPLVFPLELYPFGTYCGKNKKISDGQGNVRISEFEVSQDGGLKDVVIAVQGVSRGKPFKPVMASLEAKGCEFLPFVSIVQNHGQFTMKNEDPVLHNSQLYQAEKGNVILNVPVPPNSTDTHTINFERNKRIYKMICGMHEFMQTWGYAVDNPYYALTDENGLFTIDGVPPGTYRVVVWRPHFKPVTRKITIESNGITSLALEFDSSTVKRPHYETQEKFRIQH